MASVEPEDNPIYGSIDLEGGGIVPLLRYVSFNIRPWLEQASEEDVSRLFHAEYASQTNQEVMDWCMSRASGLKQRLQETTHRAGGHVVQRPMVDMPATADWVATNRMGWFFVPEMCRDWGIDLLVVMARQGTPARRKERHIHMNSPTRSQIHELIGSLTESELTSLLEAARVALADGDIAAQIADSMDISDSDLSAMQDRLHSILKG